MEKMVLCDVNQLERNQIREDAKWVEFGFSINYILISSTSAQSPDASRVKRAGRRPHDERENTIPNNSLLLLSPSHWAEDTAYWRAICQERPWEQGRLLLQQVHKSSHWCRASTGCRMLNWEPFRSKNLKKNKSQFCQCITINVFIKTYFDMENMSELKLTAGRPTAYKQLLSWRT